MTTWGNRIVPAAHVRQTLAPLDGSVRAGCMAGP
jgi:hypothetical protein